MKKNTMVANTLLAVVLGVGLLVGMVWRTFMPYVVLPELDGIACVGITLIALTLEYYIAGRQRRSWVLQIVLATVTFGGLALVAGLPYAGIKTFLVGAASFAAVTFLFDSMVGRLEVTTDKKHAIIPTAFVLYLASQCFVGLF